MWYNKKVLSENNTGRCAILYIVEIQHQAKGNSLMEHSNARPRPAAQNAPVGGDKGTRTLIHFVKTKRDEHLSSGKRHFYCGMYVPNEVLSIDVEGEVYQIHPKHQLREVWFRSMDKGRYDLSEFYVKEVIDPFGHHFQLHLRLVEGPDSDEVVLAKQPTELYRSSQIVSRGSSSLLLAGVRVK